MIYRSLGRLFLHTAVVELTDENDMTDQDDFTHFSGPARTCSVISSHFLDTRLLLGNLMSRDDHLLSQFINRQLDGYS